MKAFYLSLTALAFMAFFLTPELVRAQDDSTDDQGISFQTFYDQLSSDGTWVQTDDYGYVFQPNVSDPNWAPYTDGHWVYTEDGWTWDSDEPWGWATYHYGRWANIDDMGWVWVPGYQWAPAWVSWRYGDGYAGWAPLPPESFQGEEFGPGVDDQSDYHYGDDVDVTFDIGAGCYNFIPVGDFGDPNYRGHFVHRDRNYALINRTANVTNINVNRRGANQGGRNGFSAVVVGGPALADVNTHSRQHVRTMSLTAANQPGKSTVQGNALSVYAPRVNPATAKQGRPATVGQTISHPSFNRGDSITKPLAVTANVRSPAPTPAAIQAAQQAQAHIPAQAKIAHPQNLGGNNPAEFTGSPEHTSTPSTSDPAATGINPNSGNPNEVHHADASFTGEPATPQREENKTPTVISPSLNPAEPSYHPNPSVTEPPSYHPSAQPSEVEHHETSPTEVVHHDAAPAEVMHHEASPAEVVHHEAPPAEVIHHDSAPAQVFHHDAPAAAHPSAPAAQAQHSSAPAQHPSGGPTGGSGDKKDKTP